jgi:hypothetical protein
MPILEHQLPSVTRRLLNETIEVFHGPSVERQVIDSRSEPVVLASDERCRLLDRDVGSTTLPTATTVPALELGIAERFQHPSVGLDSTVKGRHPEIDVMNSSNTHRRSSLGRSPCN